MALHFRYEETQIDSSPNIARLIEAHRNGDESAYDEVVTLLYADLRRVAHQQLARYHGNATLQVTAIVNEAYLKLKKTNGDAIDRAHFLGIAAKTMRHVIIDYARRRLADKRGGGQIKVELKDEDATVSEQATQLVLIDEALDELSRTSETMARVFECKFFAELSDDETADVLEMSKRTVQREWMKARAVLSDYLSSEST